MAGWASSQNWCQQFLYRIQKQNSNSSNQAQHSTLLAKRCCKMICCLSSTWHWREATLRCRSESFFVQHSSLLHITDDVVIFVCDASLDLSVHPVQSVRLLLVILLVHFSPRLNLLGVSTSFIFIFIPCLAQWFTDYYSTLRKLLSCELSGIHLVSCHMAFDSSISSKPWREIHRHSKDATKLLQKIKENNMPDMEGSHWN